MFKPSKKLHPRGFGSRDGKDSKLIHQFGPHFNIATTIGWIAMQCYTDIHVPIRINCNNFGDSNLSKTLVYDL